MCNQLHKEFKKIKSKGYGYKIFGIKDSPCFGFNKQMYSKICKDDWIIWDCEYGDGFCFFTSKKEAIRLLKSLVNFSRDYSEHYIKRIEYRQGMGKHLECNIEKGQNYEIAICKEFKILELVKNIKGVIYNVIHI